MGWIYLIFAGLFEIGWPVGLKLSQSKARYVGVALIIAGVITLKVSA